MWGPVLPIPHQLQCPQSYPIEYVAKSSKRLMLRFRKAYLFHKVDAFKAIGKLTLQRNFLRSPGVKLRWSVSVLRPP